ncbi:prolyl oligopeptidase family serine peptidase [Kribbella flavida]|uniref:alpha/beta hydrolase family protein n=1 Tax=Kribbella flavida TaxID=182640 RepID=UPI0009FFF7D0
MTSDPATRERQPPSTIIADDAVAAVRLLREHPGVASRRVALWGHSQGGWIAPLAAVKAPQVAFVVTVGASAVRPDRTQLWSKRTYLTHAGVSPRLLDPIGVNLSRMLIAARLFGGTANDPLANLGQLRQPLLGVFGEQDRSTAPGESLRLFRQALERGGNQHYTLRVVPRLPHDAGQCRRLQRERSSRLRAAVHLADHVVDQERCGAVDCR